MNSPALLASAQKNVGDIVTLALMRQKDEAVLIVYDEQSYLSRLLAEAYRTVLPDAKTLNFDKSAPEEILKAIDLLAPKSLVALIQSTSFRLNEFRFRVELFKRGLKVIEHPHLGRQQEEEYATYIDALAYDPAYYRTVGPALKRRIDRAARISVICEGTELVYESAFEDAKLNIGDYSGMKNAGGQFPIGEVFSEPKEIGRVNGTLQLFAFGDSNFSVSAPDKPFTVVIEGGLLVSAPDAPSGFKTVLEQIRSEEGKVWTRELGFGLNRALTRERRLCDVGAYERMLGIHLSLGAKHALYAKPGFSRRSRFHVDVFAAVERVEIDSEKVFETDHYIVES